MLLLRAPRLYWPLTLLGASTLFLLGACGSTPKTASDGISKENALAFGAGEISLANASGRKVAVDAQGHRVTPRLAHPDLVKATSNSWWSSLIYPQNDTGSAKSLPLYAHPLVLRAEKSGVGLSYPKEPTVTAKEYMFRYQEDLRISLSGQENTSLRVLDYSDFGVRFEQREERPDAPKLVTSLTHGVPYAQFTVEGTSSVVIHLDSREGKPAIVTSGSSARIRFPKRAFGIYAPDGQWSVDGDTLRSDLGGTHHFSVAALPDYEDETVQLFEQHAFAFVNATRAEWQVDGSRVRTTYSLDTSLVAPCAAHQRGCVRSDEPLIALYPHQWAATKNERFVGSYVSPRGEMRLRVGRTFSTELVVNGLLPAPPVAEKERSEVAHLLEQLAKEELFPLGLGETPNHDAYWDGKSLGRVASAVHLADAVGKTEVRDALLSALRERLGDWFDGKAPRYFHYDAEWQSLIAFPDSYGSASHLNDHHFHYGYFIHAAATVARFDAKWARDFAPIVELLIRDVAAPRRDDTMFPRLRFMDSYAGHSWANGPAQFAEGNNEEASSEDLNFSYGVALWGALTDNRELEDLGLYLFATQTSAVAEYWFDVADRTFPASFAHPTVAMVWGAGAKYDTWFDEDPGIIHAINFLPFTGGSYYLGKRADYVRKNFAEVLRLSSGEITTWRDYLLMFAALGDPKDALRRYDEDPLFTPEFGASRAFTRAFITGLATYGVPNFSLPLASPYALAFDGEDGRTLVSFNPHKTPETGVVGATSFTIPPRKVHVTSLKKD